MTFPSGARLSVPADGLPLLPNEPCVPDWERQDHLTQHFLAPALPELEALFLHIRATLDPVLRAAIPSIIGKPYPLGQCLEISQAVMLHIDVIDPATLPPAAARGFRALQDFRRHGGTLRQVWGDLRGQYFQNAFLAGTLYLDSANDTVFVTKPKVEILPFRDAQFSPVRDYLHFARVAAKYWNALIIPNHILPFIAPYFPVLVAIPGGGITFPVSDYMFELVKREAFASSMRVVSTMPMNAALFGELQACLVGSGMDMAETADAGRTAAMDHCVRYRTEGRDGHDPDIGRIILAMHEANRLLSRLRVN